MSHSREENVPEGRREFFGEAVREALGPLAKVLEKKINPLLAVMDEMSGEKKGEGERGGRVMRGPPLPVMDQPQVYGGAERGPRVPERILRPPGALVEGKFEAACTRCGKCVEACPAKCIKADGTGLVGEGFPYIVPAEMPCVVCASLACMQVCPTGALELVPAKRIRMGLAKVDHKLCVRSSGDFCTLCVEACPMGSAAMEISGVTGRVLVKRSGCIGCGLCESVCPTGPRAVVVRAAEGKREPMIS